MAKWFDDWKEKLEEELSGGAGKRPFSHGDNGSVVESTPPKEPSPPESEAGETGMGAAPPPVEAEPAPSSPPAAEEIPAPSAELSPSGEDAPPVANMDHPTASPSNPPPSKSHPLVTLLEKWRAWVVSQCQDGRVSPAFTGALIIVGALCIWGLAALVAGGFRVEPAVPASLQVIPEEIGEITFDERYMDNDLLYIDGAEYLEKSDLEETLTITPEVSYTLAKRGNGRFELRLNRAEPVPYTISFWNPVTSEIVQYTINDVPLTVSVPDLNLQNFGVADTLVLEFSHEITWEDLYDHLTINPQFQFHLDVEENTAYLTPQENLEYTMDYMVRINKNMSSADGSFSLGKDATVKFRTQRLDFNIALTNPEAELITVDEDFVLQFNTTVEARADESKAVQPVILEVYRFPSLDKYLQQAELIIHYDVELTMLELIETDIHLLSKGLTSWELPNPGVGGYLVRATTSNPETGQEFQFRKAFSVTDLSVYAQTNNTQTLVWANSSVTGQPLAGYQVAFRQYYREDPVVSAVTDSDGVAMLEYQDQEDGYRTVTNPARILTLTDSEGRVAYVDNTNVLNKYSRYYYTDPGNRYYAYFHTDRLLYKPTDEIQFWGYIQPFRNNQDSMPDAATIFFGESAGLTESVEVPIGSDGTFIGSLPLESVRSSHYQLQLKLEEPAAAETGEAAPPEDSTQAEGEEAGDTRGDTIEPAKTYGTVRSLYVQVKEYEKPTYVINLETDKEFYLPGEKVTVTVEPTFYDGTPMPEYDLGYQVYDSYHGNTSLSGNITTDEHGIAAFTFDAVRVEKDRETGWVPIQNRFVVRITDDGENISATGSYTYLPTDIFYTSRIDWEEEGKLHFTINTRITDYDRFLSEGQTLPTETRYYSYSNLTSYTGGEDPWAANPTDMALTVNLSYSYDNMEGKRISSQKETIETATVNGSVSLLDLLPDDLNPEGYTNVSFTIYGEDSQGRTVVGKDSFYKSAYRQPIDPELLDANGNPIIGPFGYNFMVTNSSGEPVLAEYREYLTYSECSFGPGELMNFELYYRHAPASNNGRILYTVLQDKVISRGFLTSNTMQMVQSVENANSINIVAAYFDGTKVWPLRDIVVVLNKTGMDLNVEVTPDRELYEPGDTVNLSVRVTDSFGNGVSSSTIIGVVDESLFALQEQTIDPLYDLYRDMAFSHYRVAKYATTYGDYRERDELYAKGDYGKGGADNLQFIDNLRKNFKDTALFEAVRTNGAGNASLTFTLPDNVTSWRITSASIGDNGYAGYSKTNFVTTMPFFLNTVVSPKYIAGDEIAVRVQGHGIALDGDSVINYLVNVSGDGVDTTLDAQAKAYESVELNFGKLPQGEYTLVATAQYGAYTDAVETRVAVISSNLELVVHRKLDLTKPLELSAMRYPVTISLYDQRNDAYFDSISSLLTHYCMIANQRLSRYAAKQKLTEYMDPSEIPAHILAEDTGVYRMQNSDGGVGWNEGDKSDLLLTSQVVLVARDEFDQSSMAGYFRRAIEEHSRKVYLKGEEEEEKASSRSTATTEEEERPFKLVPDTEERWKYAGASYLGLAHLNEPVVDEIYALLEEEDIPLIGRVYLIAALAYAGEEGRAHAEYNQFIKPLIKSYPSGGVYVSLDGEATADVTSIAWVAASRLHLDDADDFARAYSSNSWRIGTLFECMAYVLNYDKEIDTDQYAFTYSVNGETFTESLGLRGQATKVFNKSEMGSLGFLSVPEGMLATAYYIGEPEEMDFSPTELFTVHKSVTDLLTGRYQVTLTLEFGDEAPTGQYDISEWVPSNMRLYSIDSDRSGKKWDYRSSTEGQKLYFTVQRYSSDVQSVTLQYTAQKTYDSVAMMDSTYVIHGDTGENTRTERMVFGE